MSSLTGKNIPILTGLRGFAALIVFVSHAAKVGFLPAVLGKGFGQSGVMLFFMLSGFLMAHLYVSRDFTKESVVGYSLARIGRVIPLYLLVLLASVLITNLIYPNFRYAFTAGNPDQLLQALLFHHAPYELWTIPVEVQFYVFFPLVWFLTKRGAGAKTLILVTGAAMLPGVLTIAITRTNYDIFPTYAHAFMLGALTSIFLPSIKKHLIDRIPPWAGYLLLALVCLNLPVLRMEHGLALAKGQFWISTWLDPITWVLIYSLFLACLGNIPSVQILRNRLFEFFGDISYGFYLLHYPVLMAVAEFLGTDWLAFVVATLASVALSAVSLRYFERPMMSRIRALQAKKATVEATALG